MRIYTITLKQGDKVLRVIQECRGKDLIREIDLEGDLRAFGNPPLIAHRDYLYYELTRHVANYPGMTFSIEDDGGECPEFDY